LWPSIATPQILTLSLHDALPIFRAELQRGRSTGDPAATSLCLGQALSSVGPMDMWDPEPGWLNTASYGLPPRVAWEALQAALARSEEHTSELQSRFDLVCRLLLE